MCVCVLLTAASLYVLRIYGTTNRVLVWQQRLQAQIHSYEYFTQAVPYDFAPSEMPMSRACVRVYVHMCAGVRASCHLSQSYADEFDIYRRFVSNQAAHDFVFLRKFL